MVNEQHAALVRLTRASRRVLNHLNRRILEADPSAVPLFDGIAELDAALRQAKVAVDWFSLAETIEGLEMNEENYNAVGRLLKRWNMVAGPAPTRDT